MQLKDIQRLQREFDEEFFNKFWEINDEKTFIERLQYLVVALTGEIGEYANIVKKASRDFEHLKENISEEKKKQLTEELVDCFIYIIITANLLGIDLEKEYLEKLEKNKQRFEKYKRG
ncbi:MAG: MazG nucleotide pyrophosphohydrolase domain-containing protein [Candidatus Aenigmatarchaeota archaeon]|nr:dUTP diphosphatase [Candidatus Aenigmarchaeota archaeon]